MEFVRRDSTSFPFFPPRWKSDKDVVLAACENNLWALQDAGVALESDRKAMIEIVCALNLREGDHETVFEILFSLQEVFGHINDDKEIMLPLSEKYGLVALKHATKRLQADKDVVLAACRCDGYAIIHASKELWLDKDVVVAACSNYPLALSYIARNYNARSHNNNNNSDMQELPLSLSECTPAPLIELLDNKEVILAACCSIKNRGDMLQHASTRIRNDKDVVTAICRRDGNALQHASDNLRADKDVVLVAVGKTPSSLKYALGGLNQDKECLVAAGIWDNNYHHGDQDNRDNVHVTNGTFDNTGEDVGNNSSDDAATVPRLLLSSYEPRIPRRMKLVLSTRFSLNEQSTSQATHFTIGLKENQYIRDNFIVYSPNAYSKSTCDPNWTDPGWPCRGTFETCLMDDGEYKPRWKLGDEEEEDNSSTTTSTTVLLSGGCCWRYSFRYQLETAKACGGAMIQFVDYDDDKRSHVLGDGQRIETEMARDVGIKVFKFYSGLWKNSVRFLHMVDLIDALKVWCHDGQQDQQDAAGIHGTNSGVQVDGTSSSVSSTNIYSNRQGCTCPFCSSTDLQ